MGMAGSWSGGLRVKPDVNYTPLIAPESLNAYVNMPIRKSARMATVLDTDELRTARWKLAKQQADELSAPYSSPPIPVLEIAESNGVDVVFSDFGPSGEKVAGFCDFHGAKLYVNADDPINRQTFTIAHELGHWILHRSFFERRPDLYHLLPRFQRAERGNPFEQEANCFAANLLVPRKLLIPVKDAPVTALSTIFAVSREMMENRLKNV